MKNSIKSIISYLILFVESILLFILTTLLITKFTIFNTSYIRNTLEKNNYYQDLYDDIKVEMSYYTNQSGFEDSILDDTFTIGEVRYETNKYIENIYKGKTLNIDIINLQSRLNNNINEYVRNQNFKVIDQKEIDKFIQTMCEVYQDEIKLMGYAEKGASIVTKIISLSNKLIIVLSVALVLLIVLNTFVLKRNNFAIVLYTSAFIILFCNHYFKANIDIKNIFIYSKLVSDIIKHIINSLLHISIIISIIYIILGIILAMTKKLKKSY